MLQNHVVEKTSFETADNVEHAGSKSQENPKCTFFILKDSPILSCATLYFLQTALEHLNLEPKMYTFRGKIRKCYNKFSETAKKNNINHAVLINAVRLTVFCNEISVLVQI